MAAIYINAPFTRAEYKAIEALAKKEGRSKGKQLRELALSAIGFVAVPEKKGGAKP